MLRITPRHCPLHPEGFDPRYTDAGNYGYGLSAAAAGFSLDDALRMAAEFNKKGTGRPLPAINENAIRTAFDDYAARRFSDPDHDAGAAHIWSSLPGDGVSALRTFFGFLRPPPRITESDVQRYAKARWGDLNSRDAQAFMANFQQAFDSYPQHVDIDLLYPLPADGSIPSGRDVSLFVGKNGEVLVYAKPPAPGGTGAFRGIYGLDGAPDGSGSTGLPNFFKDGTRAPPGGSGSTGLNFFEDGTPQPGSVLPHHTTPDDPTGGIDVTLADGSKEHWWQDPIDGFIRARQGGDGTPSKRLGPRGALDSPSPDTSLSFEVRPWAPSPEDVTDAPAMPSPRRMESTFDDRYANSVPSPVAPQYPPPPAQSPNPGQPDPKDFRVLSSFIRAPDGSLVPAPLGGTSAPGVPFVSTSDVLSEGRPASFNDRFGNWTSSRPAVPPAPQPQRNNATQPDPKDLRTLSSFIRAPDGSLIPAPLGGPNPPQTQAQSDRPLGLFSGEPMPGYPMPPPIFDFPDRSTRSGDNMDDWFTRWIKPLMQQ
jgi:hypothetical protein